MISHITSSIYAKHIIERGYITNSTYYQWFEDRVVTTLGRIHEHSKEQPVPPNLSLTLQPDHVTGEIGLSEEQRYESEQLRETSLKLSC